MIQNRVTTPIQEYIPRNCASWTDYYRKQRRLEHLKDVCVFVGLIILFTIASCI